MCPVSVYGFLTAVHISNWMPVLHMPNMLRIGFPWLQMVNELQSGYCEVKSHTLIKWRRLYQESVGKALVNLNEEMIVGAKPAVVS